MKLSDISDVEYRYLFAIDNIKTARQMSCDRWHTLEAIGCIPEPVKKRIKEFSDDLDSVAEKIISRTDIDEIEQYDALVKTAVICNAKIADELTAEEIRNKVYRKYLKHNKNDAETINCFDAVNLRLGNITYLRLQLNNWVTLVILILLAVIFLVSTFCFYETYQYVAVLITDFLCAFFIFIAIPKIGVIRKLMKQDYIQRIISGKEFYTSRIQEKHDKHIDEIIKNTILKRL